LKTSSDTIVTKNAIEPQGTDDCPIMGHRIANYFSKIKEH